MNNNTTLRDYMYDAGRFLSPCELSILTTLLEKVDMCRNVPAPAPSPAPSLSLAMVTCPGCKNNFEMAAHLVREGFVCAKCKEKEDEL